MRIFSNISPKQKTLKIVIFFFTLLAIILFTVLWFLPGDKNSKYVPYPLSKAEHFSHNWINQAPCKAPCWEGITPESTTTNEAIQILKSNSLFKDVRKNKEGYITWSWSDNSNIQGGKILYHLDGNELIYNIIPNFERSYKLREVIQTYGEPSYISAYKFLNGDAPPNYNLRLYFSNVGILLKSYEPTDLGFALTPELLVFGPEFSLKNMEIIPTIKTILPWQGFRNFNFYCRDRNDNMSCQ